MPLKVFSPAVGLIEPNATSLNDPESWPVLASPMGATMRQSTVDFLRAIHGSATGFLELRAFNRESIGRPAPAYFVPLPLTDHGLAQVHAYATKWDAYANIYHAVATRRWDTSGKLEDCSELCALFCEIDLKDGVPMRDIWRTLMSFALAPSYIVHSGGGLHVYWCLSEPIDLTTDLGLARAYQWLGDLAHRLGGDRAAAEPARILRVPDTHNRKAAYGPHSPLVTLLVANPDARYSLSDVIGVLGDADPTRAATSVSPADVAPVPHGFDEATRIRLARTWLERQAPAIEGRNGDKHTFSVCASVAVGHDLDESNALTALQDWNARCEPPWSVAELRQKIRNAIRYAKGQRGAKLVEFPCTEVGDAECFADRYGDTVRYDHRQGRWLLATESGIWEPDPTEQLHRLVTSMMRDRQQRALLIADADEKKKYLKWAFAGESRKRITNTLALAQSLPPIADAGDGWDPDPMLLGVPNGVIDLRTGLLRPALPSDRVTLRARTPFDPAATCPLWERTLLEIHGNDAEMVAFMQRAYGYSISGDCREECFFLGWGDGRNGKGTEMNTISWVLGDYHENLSISALEQATRSASASPELAKLVHRRFVTASETDDVQLNEKRIKALTGRDPMSARFLFQNEFTFIPEAKFWLATNRKPVIRDSSQGFWSRVKLIPFTVTFAGQEDKTRKDRLREEAPGILVWLVRGCVAWQREGLNPPKAVEAATDEYRKESSQLSRYLDATCDFLPDGKLQSGPAFQGYRRFCERAREVPEFNQTTFGMEMQKRFQTQKSRHTYYVGVAFREISSEF